MATVVVLKVLHYVSLFLAGGLGVANVMLFNNHQKAGIPPAPLVQKTMMTLARLGLIAIVTLWLTGIPLTYKVYGSFDLNWSFHVKLFGATSSIGVVAFLNIYLIWNEGIAFGLLSFGSKAIYNFITILILIINIIIIYIIFKLEDFRKYFFLIILGGSLGNLFDRMVYNAVPDFIDFHIGNLHWFIFNPADIFITIGVICLILDEFFFKNKKI